MGYVTKEIKVDHLNKCYLATRGNDNILFIPSNITDVKLEILPVSGNLQILGGYGLISAQYMFYNVKVNTLDLTLLNNLNMVSMKNMFNGASINNLLLGENFFGPKVKDVKYMFNTKTKLNVDMSHVKVAHLSNIDYMFSGSNLGMIKLFNLDGVKSAVSLFEMAHVDLLDLSHWNITKLDNYNYC